MPAPLLPWMCGDKSVRGTQICFLESGNILMLDAATAPRSIVDLTVYRAGLWTCVQIDRAGTVVLLPGDPVVEDAPVEASASVSQVEPDTSPVVNLAGCGIVTNYILRFRDGPGGQSIDAMLVPYNTWLNAHARTDHWFQVTYLGTMGWISADYVTMTGACG